MRTGTLHFDEEFEVICRAEVDINGYEPEDIDVRELWIQVLIKKGFVRVKPSLTDFKAVESMVRKHVSDGIKYGGDVELINGI